MSTVLIPLICLLLPLAISWLLTALLLRVAPRLGLIDQPSERKIHTRPTPKGGGLAIYAAVLATAAIAFAAGWVPVRQLVLPGLGGLIVLLGLVDDRYSLPWQLRLGLQTVAVLLAFSWPMNAGWLPWPLALLWAVGLVNAFNMLDNMDALSAGVASIITALLACALCLRFGAEVLTRPDWLPYLMLLGALLGFLWFNRPPARIFMGDAGSTFLGFFLSLHCLQDDFATSDNVASWVAPLCIFSAPWYDLISVVSLRISQGRSPFQPDRKHLSHRLVELGLSSTTAVGAIYCLTLASGVGGLLLYRMSTDVALLGAVQLVAWWGSLAWIDYFARRG
jgi:UDP-GlcNAc:undecaprenyl-phosphate GlcNAc-1-phosphate transferase